MKMKLMIVAVLLFLSGLVNAQNTLDWSPDYQLQLSDFQSAGTQVDKSMTLYSLHNSAVIDFAFHMSAIQFMMTKNFNSKVGCTFTRDVAAIIAPDAETAQRLVEFARFEFDLSELYARKFRQKLFEEKSALSDFNYVQPLFDEIRKQNTARLSEAGKLTDLGQKKALLEELHAQVLKEIAELPDYCKTCKPKKKK